MYFLIKTTYFFRQHHSMKSVASLFSLLNKKYHTEVKIGNVAKSVTLPNNPHLVPTGYLPIKLSQTMLQHFQWIMKKDILGQDIFLIGVPGPLRGRVVLQYLELMKREVEYVVLTRDTTENDLKQRREILNGTAHYVDQSAVNAAIEGRFLVLDGVEKVERNVLPVLNNLLENREMQLEDGRFLIAPERYDKLLSEHGKEVLDNWKLVRVSENFRIVALGLPVPPFKGNPLDPPFRSRFQARHISANFEDYESELSNFSSIFSHKELKKFLSASYAFHSSESESLGLPKFPIDNLLIAFEIFKKVPNVPFDLMFKWMYPYSTMLSKEGQKQVLDTLKSFSIAPKSIKSKYKVTKNDKEKDCSTYSVDIYRQGRKASYDVTGHSNQNMNETLFNFVPNDYHINILTDMLNTHAAHDFCLIGNKGSGKSILVRKFASLLNYPVEMVMLYADMTARDLLQQRITDEKGNTLWRPSQLINAARNGKLLVLDGLHRLHHSTLSALQRLIHNREMQLFDGMRLVSFERYEKIKEENGFSDVDMKERNIASIHHSFRIVALAEMPKTKTSKDQWITPEVMSMFLFHNVQPLSLEEERYIIKNIVKKDNKKIDSILDFAHKLRSSDDETLLSVSASFSTRQLIRLAQRLSVFPDVSVYNLLTQACLLKFLPQITKQAVENILETCEIKKSNMVSVREIHVENGTVFVGNTSVPVYDPGNRKVKVPNILFFDNPEHIEVMEAMLQDFILGEHLLLVGNQGVGKNKITDRFLQLLNRPREYIQLHRDTTVQSLTQQSTVVEGKIIYEDSPLLRAVQFGHVLIVDEADKAPTHVTSILKALVESGEMVLSDGRCIVHHTDVKFKNDPNKVIMHPDFRMIVLANRPGFPFLGNDFFATLGDIFSCHAVDNPTLQSEITMLHQYAPNVSEDVLKKLAKLFGELRTMSDSGLISYPYSIREVVNVTKHIGQFPEERISQALKNVFDFDYFSTDVKNTIHNLFTKYGISFESETVKVDTAEFYQLPEITLKASLKCHDSPEIWMPEVHSIISGDEHTWPVEVQKLDVIETRGSVFSEQINYCKMAIKNNDIPLSIDSTQSEKQNILYVATANPISLHMIDQDKSEQKSIKLPGYFPSIRSGFKPSVNISSLSLQNENSIFFHETTSNQFFLANVKTGLVKRINVTSFFEDALSKITSAVYPRSSPKPKYFYIDFPSKQKIIIFRENSNKLILLDFVSEKVFNLNTSQNINHMSVLDENTLSIVSDKEYFVVDIHNPLQWQLKKLEGMPLNDKDSIARSLTIDPSSKLLTKMEDSSATVMLNSDDYASIISGSLSNNGTLDLYCFSRSQPLTVGHRRSCILPSSNIGVRLLQSHNLPRILKNKLNNGDAGFIEVVNLKDLTYGYIKVTLPRFSSSVASWLADTSESYLQMCLSPNEELVTIDLSGYLRRWQINKQNLENSFVEWQKQLGFRNEEQLTIEYSNPNPAVGPKHGKIDPAGSPHVGGNTWAGGTGGRDTAGLGGKGGPYRLDAGHKVFQLPDSEKQAVPPEVREAARKMAIKAYKDKLKEIEMSEYDAEIYENFLSNVQKEINILRVIIDGLQAKSKERQWMRHQTSGELDDAKLIESITGEKSVYKKRGEQEPEVGSPQEKPKLLRLVVDVSGSMYRFNGLDNRLQRELESIVLVMEAFDSCEDKFKYEILGHSGEEFNIEFSPFKKPPKNKKHKLDILRKMLAHSQFCMSGDNTLPATQHAIKTITNEDADEYFVIILSDANFDRYGISPVDFSNMLVSNPKVNAFAVFIGSLGNEASILMKQMPPGRAFLCFDSAKLTQILQKIFTSALLKD